MDEMKGRIIGGRFRVERIIGMGGMGAVYQARHLTLPRTFAIKILRPEMARDEGLIERFRREAYAASRVEHPHVIYITDFGQTEEDSVYLVMEYVQGIGLDQLIAQEGKLPPNRALSILAQIADALDMAHQVNVIHRDLKPENILLSVVRGRKDFVKLLDFGIAKVQTPEFDGTPLTIQGEVFGTAEYMSPEQASGQRVDGRSDIYALGCLAFELFTGDPPFLGSSVEVLRSHVYSEPPLLSDKISGIPILPTLDSLLSRCLAKDPAARHQTGAELRQDLLRIRALLFSMSGEIMQNSRMTKRMSVISADKMISGWQPLGGKIPEMLLPSNTDPLLTDISIPLRSTQRQAASPEKLRDKYWDTLRELAIALDMAALAPDEFTGYLERLLVVEEQIASLTGSIALTEKNFGRIRFEYGQKERRFRHAVVDLGIDLARLQGQVIQAPAAKAELQAQISDLIYQIDELNKRCQEIERERQEQIQELDQEVKRIRNSRVDLENEAAEIFQKIHAQVEILRARVNTQELEELYVSLDHIRITMDQSHLL